jgi:iron complex transport system permease protein
MLVMAVGGPIWDWSKWSGGAGLALVVRAAPFGESKAVPAFLWASIGAALSALLLPQAPASVRENKNWMYTKKISTVAIVAAAISLVGFLIGSGPSILSEEVYGLGADGNAFLLRMFWPVGVIIGLIPLALIAFEKDRKLRFWMIGIATLWFICSAATGSRTAVAFPLVGALLIIRHQVSKRRLHLPIIAAALILLATSVVTFSVSLEARSIPHGLLNLPNVVGVTISDSLASTDSFLHPLKQLASSVFVSVPDAEQSATYGVGLDVLVANANVLPGTAQPMELERYWPYVWVPLSFAGSWFGATGWVGQFLLFGAIGWMCGYTADNIQRSRFNILSFAPIYTASMIGLLSAQYSSRMVWRVVSIGIFLLIASFLARRTRAQELVEKREHIEHVLNAQDIDKKTNASIAHNDVLTSN